MIVVVVVVAYTMMIVAASFVGFSSLKIPTGSSSSSSTHATP